MAIKKIAKNQTFSLDYIRTFINKTGCELLDDKYENGRIKLNIRCKCGKIFERNFNIFSSSRNRKVCPICSLKLRSGENHYEWRLNREDYIEEYKFRQKCYKMLKHALKSIYREKVGHTKDMLGYTHQDLREIIKKHPNWDKVKNEDWHLDHIFPVQAFLDYSIKDTKLINALDNLQPLSRSENCAKSDKYDKKEFEKWLKQKGVKIDDFSK